MEKPDRWVVVKIQDYYKLFATYLGGYLDGDYWRMNSGIKSITEDESYYYFHGYSGSIYKCQKNYYGCSNYTQSVLYMLINDAMETHNMEMTILPQETNFINLINYDSTTNILDQLNDPE